MANEIKIIKLDDITLGAIEQLARSLDKFREDIRPFLNILRDTPYFELAEFKGEITAVIDGEEYVA